ncbi:MAG: hypothetical protein NPIRA04_30500 [Nitrospirales bacterium]|nr:MAG: hypothetical protein NPIRA04_30500 [Nitrospirales bacterium]
MKLAAESREQSIRSIVLHPVLFALFPTIFLFFHNYGQVTIRQLVLPLEFTVVLLIGIWLLLGFLLEDVVKSGLAVSLFFLLFFSFGHALELLPNDVSLFNRYVLLLILWPSLFLCWVWWIKRTAQDLTFLSHAGNVIGLIFISMSIIPGDLLAAVMRQSPEESFSSSKLTLEANKVQGPSRLPDIYYIMIDGYTRQDILQEVFNYDNHEFLSFLRQNNFYVSDRAHANYSQTWLSLTASLNLNYVDQLLDIESIPSHDRTPLRDRIQNNWVVDFLKSYGYTFVSFDSGMAFTDMAKADIVLPRKPVIDEFLGTLLRYTPLLGIFYVTQQLDDAQYMPIPSLAYQAHRERIEYALDTLPTLTKLKSPLFAFAHVLAPHPPFVFGENGEPIDPERQYETVDGTHYYEKGGTREEYLKNYPRQIHYLNKKLAMTIREILHRSPEDPVIILQADHGSRMQLDWGSATNTNFNEAYSIFSALYLPGMTFRPAYNDISPVNTFRLVFNAYFGTDFKILENKSYYSTWENPYKFVDITEQVNF